MESTSISSDSSKWRKVDVRLLEGRKTSQEASLLEEE